MRWWIGASIVALVAFAIVVMSRSGVDPRTAIVSSGSTHLPSVEVPAPLTPAASPAIDAATGTRSAAAPKKGESSLAGDAPSSATRRVAGVVRRHEPGRPSGEPELGIANARIEIRDESGLVVATSACDGQGRFEVAFRTTLPVWLWAAANGYRTARFESRIEPDESSSRCYVDLERLTRTITGRILTLHGETPDPERLRALLPPEEPLVIGDRSTGVIADVDRDDPHPWARVEATVSIDAATFRLDFPADARGRIRGLVTGHSLGEARFDANATSGDLALDFAALDDRGTIELNVADGATGRALAGVVVLLTTETADGEFILQRRGGWTGFAGPREPLPYRITGLFPGRYRAQLTAAGHAPLSRTIDLAARTVERVDLQLEKGVVLTVRMRGSEPWLAAVDDPVCNAAEVRIGAEEIASQSVPGLRVFRFAGLGPGTAVLVLHGNCTKVEVGHDDLVVDWTVERPEPIQFDARSEERANAEPSFTEIFREDVSVGFLVGARTAPDRVRYSGRLAPGAYRARFGSSDGRPIEREFAVSASGTVIPAEFDLRGQ